MKTADTLSLTHERVDDIPLLLGFMQQLNFPDLLERHLGSHHLHRGLSNPNFFLRNARNLRCGNGLATIPTAFL